LIQASEMGPATVRSAMVKFPTSDDFVSSEYLSRRGDGGGYAEWIEDLI